MYRYSRSKTPLKRATTDQYNTTTTTNNNNNNNNNNNKKLEEFKRLSSNIKLINAHDALLLLKASSNTSHVLFMLLCSPCLGNAILSQIDEVLKSNISHIANVVLSDVQWIKASLPVKAGGLGIRRAASLALPAHLASATSTASLQDLILIRSVAAADKYYSLYRSN